MPAPLGPSTATNSPRPIAQVDARPDRRAAARCGGAARARSPRSGRCSARSRRAASSAAPPASPSSSRDHPVLEARAFRGQRLGDGGDRDRCGFGRVVEPLHVGGRVLAVVDPDLDLLVGDLAVGGRLVGGASVRCPRRSRRGSRVGVSSFSPSAGASGSKMLSEAPTGVPRECGAGSARSAGRSAPGPAVSKRSRLRGRSRRRGRDRPARSRRRSPSITLCTEVGEYHW